MSTKATISCLVLTDPFLLRAIVLFQSGLPRDIVEQVRAIRSRVARSKYPKEIIGSLPLEAIRRQDFILLKRIHRYQVEQPNYARLPRDLSFDGSWIEALDAGNVEIAAWIKANLLDPKHFSVGGVRKALKRAIQARDVGVVSFLLSRGGVVLALGTHFVKLAIEYDAANVLVRFLLEHRTEGCKSSAMELALAQNHTRVLNVIHEFCVSTPNAAAPAKSVETQTWARERQLYQKFAKPQRYRAIEQAARDGDLPTFQILHLHWHECCTVNACITPAEAKHDTIVQFLLLNCLSAQEI